MTHVVVQVVCLFRVSNNSELVGLADAESDAEKISEASHSRHSME